MPVMKKAQQKIIFNHHQSDAYQKVPHLNNSQTIYKKISSLMDLMLIPNSKDQVQVQIMMIKVKQSKKNFMQTRIQMLKLINLRLKLRNGEIPLRQMICLLIPARILNTLKERTKVSALSKTMLHQKILKCLTNKISVVHKPCMLYRIMCSILSPLRILMRIRNQTRN